MLGKLFFPAKEQPGPLNIIGKLPQNKLSKTAHKGFDGVFIPNQFGKDFP